MEIGCLIALIQLQHRENTATNYQKDNPSKGALNDFLIFFDFLRFCKSFWTSLSFHGLFLSFHERPIGMNGICIPDIA
jgi:hypothetical protein